LGSRYKSEYQELDQKPLFDSITKMNVELPRADRAADLLRTAIRVAVTGCPGPVHIDVPADLMAADAGNSPVYAETQFAQYPGTRPRPSEDDVERASSLLRGAKKPAIIAGSGVISSRGWEVLTKLAEDFDLPVATTMGGKGSIAEIHPNSIGLVGRYSRKSTNDLVSEADVVLAVGCTLGGLGTNRYTIPSPDAKIIHVDVNPTVLGTSFREEVSIQADAKVTLEDIRECLSGEGQGSKHPEWLNYTRSTTATWQERYEAAAEQSRPGNIQPYSVFRSLQEVMQPTDVLVADTGYMGAWAGALYQMPEAGNNFIRTGGSLGWGLPAGLGAQVARPTSRVVTIIGDGGIGYHIGDMETAKRLKLPVLVVVLNNQSLAFEYHIQKYLYDTEVALVNDFYDVNYAEVAKAFGWYGYRVTDPAEITSRLREALDSGEPALVEVMVDKETMAPVTFYESKVDRVL
jgi:acetolactate synthase-1/2/3 large subunit